METVKKLVDEASKMHSIKNSPKAKDDYKFDRYLDYSNEYSSDRKVGKSDP